MLTAHFTATTYRQEEPDEADDDGAAAARHAADPAARAGQAHRAGEAPPALTPQGAKLRVEDSLHKADVRDRNAAGVNEAKTPAGSAQRAKGGR